MTFTGTLKPYQVDDVNKMVEKKTILNAYMMGTGKTIMTIATIERLKGEGEIEHPTLVIVLASLKYQWASEIKKFSDSISVVIDGSKNKRLEGYESIATLQGNSTPYVIVNYESIVNDWDALKDIRWGAIICDEVTAIKGFRSQRSKRVKELSKKIPIRIGLTGTPIDNGLPESLFSIFQFIDDTVLRSWKSYDSTFIVRNHFGGVLRYRNLGTLHRALSPHVVRKTQTDPDVAPYLPEAVSRDPLIVRFDPKSYDLYKTIAEELSDELVEASEMFGSSFSLAVHYGQGNDHGSAADAVKGSIMAKIVAMRMVCDHPELLQSSAYTFSNTEGVDGSGYAYTLDQRGLLTPTKSPKLEVLIPYIKDHLESDASAKVVVFVSYVGMLPIIQEHLGLTGSVIYSGKLTAVEKETAKQTFLTDPLCKVFISSDAGGYGVDLPVANLLINYDLPWSAALAAQRDGRILRASSRWPVVTYQSILMKDSIEERQYAMLKQKTSVADAIVDGLGINGEGGVDFTVGSLLKFLQSKYSA